MFSVENQSKSRWPIGDGWLQLLVGLLILGAWQAASLTTTSIWLSPPRAIAERILQWLREDLLLHFAVTMAELLSGLAIGTVSGVVLGLILGCSGEPAKILRPLIVGIYSVPLVAVTPLFIMFFGMDMAPKVILVSLVVFFLLFFNTFTGAESVDKDLISAANIMGSNRWERFTKVIAPACTAWTVGGLNIALPYALVATVTGEILAARRGLGFLLNQSATQFDVTGVYAVLVILMILGFGLSEGMKRIEGWLLRWRE